MSSYIVLPIYTNMMKTSLTDWICHTYIIMMESPLAI